MKFIRDNFTSPRGRFFSSMEKIVDNFTSLRGRSDSLREEVVEKEKHVRCIIPPVVSPSQRWHVVQHKNFS